MFRLQKYKKPLRRMHCSVVPVSALSKAETRTVLQPTSAWARPDIPPPPWPDQGAGDAAQPCASSLQRRRRCTASHRHKADRARARARHPQRRQPRQARPGGPQRAPRPYMNLRRQAKIANTASPIFASARCSGSKRLCRRGRSEIPGPTRQSLLIRSRRPCPVRPAADMGQIVKMT
jgi:hypothetical protein